MRRWGGLSEVTQATRILQMGSVPLYGVKSATGKGLI